jgi:aspartyl-tRNA(Asn)/glutamyl-tRNA(Gln) amidotransferase subunit A
MTMTKTPLRPLDRVPCSVKDNLFAADMPTTWGSAQWKEFAPSDLSVERLEKGAFNLGKTNTPRWKPVPTPTTFCFGVTRNPHDTSLTPAAPAGGNGDGGSTRSPASITGLLWLRSTNRRVARAFGFPPLMIDFQAIGLFTRSLAESNIPVS